MFAARPSRLTVQAALLLVGVVGLFWRAVIPAGFMPERQNAGWVLSLCTGQGVATIVVDLDGKPVKHDDTSDTAPSTCAFASLAAPAMSAAAPVLLAIAIAYIIVQGRSAATEPIWRLAERLRPPLRAPPVC